MNPILAPLLARRSVRKYQNRPVPEGILRDVLEAAMSAPSANEKDPWEILVVQKPEVLAQIAAQGVDLDDVFKKLEDEGVAKFIASWDSELVTSVEQALAAAK